MGSYGAASGVVLDKMAPTQGSGICVSTSAVNGLQMFFQITKICHQEYSNCGDCLKNKQTAIFITKARVLEQAQSLARKQQLQLQQQQYKLIKNYHK